MSRKPALPVAPPSAWQVEQALATWFSTRARLLAEDAALGQDEAALTELLGGEDAEIDDILARLLRGAVHAESMQDAAKDRAEAIRARATRYERRADSLRAAAYVVLEALGRRKFELPDLTASINASGQSVVITDEAAVPDIYVETVRKIDKQTIRSVLKSGGTVAGAELSNGLDTLTIRTR